MKSTTELAREAGMDFVPADHHCREQYWTATPEELEAFRTLIIADLASGAGEPVHHIMVDGECIGYFSATQLAAAVAQKVAEYEGLMEDHQQEQKMNMALREQNTLLDKALAELEERLREIGDMAHDKSTGPAVPDVYWEIRSMAYDLI